MPKIDVCSRLQVHAGGFYDENKILISIQNPSKKYTYRYYPEYERFYDHIILEFWDLTALWQSYELFNSDIADQIYAFIAKHPDRDIVIHCDAGASRSVAVGTVLRDLIGYEVTLNSYDKEDCRNSLVVEIMENQFPGKNDLMK